MVFADALLAQRLEAAEAANARGCSRRGANVLEVAGGCAIFSGADSPLTHAVGIGLNGAVTDAQIDALETFFRSRGARATIDLCPLADPGLLQALGERGYRPTEFSNVLVRRLARSEIVLTPRVRRAVTGEDDPWSYAVGQGFFDQPELSTEEMDVGRAIFAMPGAMCYLGVAETGASAGGAALAVRKRARRLQGGLHQGDPGGVSAFLGKLSNLVFT